MLSVSHRHLRGGSVAHRRKFPQGRQLVLWAFGKGEEPEALVGDLKSECLGLFLRKAIVQDKYDVFIILKKKNA